MRKKLTAIFLILFFMMIGSTVLYHNVGWFQGDTLDYIREHYFPDGKTIVSGEYLAAGEDQEGGFIIYQVTTENGQSHYIRIHVVFHRYLNKVGPDFKIKEISEIDNFDTPTHP